MGLNNISSVMVSNNLIKTEDTLKKVFEKISTGLRINRSADDSAGLAISEKMKAQIRGLDQAQRNTQDGICLIDCADQGLANILSPTLQRARELVVNALNGTLSSNDRAALQAELEQMKNSINDIANGTHYNGIDLLNGSGTVDKSILSAPIPVSAASSIDVTVGKSGDPDQIVTAGTITVPNPPNPSTLWVQGDFGSISGSAWPDINIKSPSGDWFGYNCSYLNSGGAAVDTSNPDSTKATYTGFSATQEKMSFENPIPGEWTVEVRNLGGIVGSTFNITSNYLINIGSSPSGSVGSSTEMKVTIGDEVPKLKLQVGANSGDTFQIALTDARTTALGIDEIVVDPFEEAMKALDLIDKAIANVSSERSKYGAYRNALEHVINNTQNGSLNLTSAQSRISDSDMAKEIMNLTKQTIISNASTAILAQANQQAGGILKLLQQKADIR